MSVGGLRPIEWEDWKNVKAEPGVVLLASQSNMYYYYHYYVMCVMTLFTTKTACSKGCSYGCLGPVYHAI